MARKSIQNIIILVLTLSIVAVVAGCTIGVGNDAPDARSTPTAGSNNTLPATSVAILDTPIPGTGNTLAISEPAANAVVGDKVVVKGQGVAFDSHITVEVLAGNSSIGKSVVNTNGAPGQMGTFETTVVLAPVAAETDGLITIYTNSGADGSIDQRASVPVKLEAHGSTEPTRARGNHPNIAISPSRGRPGTEVTVVGGGFPPDSMVQIRLGGLTTGVDSKVYAETQAGQHGNIQASFIMPEHWGTGEPINSAQVTIVAATPDFVTKATAQFSYDTSPTPTAGQGVSFR